MARSVPEWIGKADDARVPPRVRLRIFRAYEGRCYLSGREIRPGEAWELEHKVALILGGEHRESNLAPALAEFHKAKTAAELKVRAKTDAIAKRHRGIVGAPKLKGAPFAKTGKSARREKHAAEVRHLAPKRLFWSFPAPNPNEDEPYVGS
jgi:5-methylcytosine-specific restriction protein A